MITTGARGNELQQLRERIGDTEGKQRALPSRFQQQFPRVICRYITQTAHGLQVGWLARANAGLLVASVADSPAHAHHNGLVVHVPHANALVLALPGSFLTGLSGLTPGPMYIHPTSNGLLTATAPTHMRLAFFALTTTSGFLLPDGPCCTVSTGDPGSTAAADGDIWYKY